MEYREETRVTLTLNEDEIRMAVAEYLNKLHPEARLLYEQVVCYITPQMEWRAEASWKTKGDTNEN